MLTGVHTLTIMTPVWAQAVLYLARRAGYWVSSWELGDHVYGAGCYSRHAPHELVRRARRAGVPIESNRALGYRLGRDRSLICSSCGSLRVRYADGEVVCYGCVGTEYVDLEVGRAPYREGSRQGKPWTEEEKRFVLENDALMGLEELGRRLDRSASAVRGLRAQLGLPRKPYVRGGS